MAKMNGKLILFSAPSGAGKTTIVKYLCKNIPDIEFSISATTREKRANEEEGKDYYFLTLEEFTHRIAKKQFAEFEEVYSGTFYGTLHTEMERIWNLGKSIIFDLDVQGGLRLKKKFGDQALAIFVKPPSMETLIHRLTLRATETSQKISERILKAGSEMAFEKDFDLILLNDNLEVACETAQNWVLDFLGASE
jgi:guanylate kinase